jgi:hypothetical protein
MMVTNGSIMTSINDFGNNAHSFMHTTKEVGPDVIQEECIELKKRSNITTPKDSVEGNKD